MADMHLKLSIGSASDCDSRCVKLVITGWLCPSRTWPVVHCAHLSCSKVLCIRAVVYNAKWHKPKESTWNVACLAYTSLSSAYLAGTLAGQDAVPEEMHTDCVDSDAYDAAPSCSAAGAHNAAATAEPPKYIIGCLKAKLASWRLFCTSSWVLSWISHGYQITWGERGLPPPYAFANQQGALKLSDFVSGEIADLLARNSIIQIERPPLVINPLNGVEHNGKLRLILDMVYVNCFISRRALSSNLRASSCTSRPMTACSQWTWKNCINM